MKICGVCGTEDNEAKAAKWLFGIKGPLCFYCFSVWYNGGTTSVEEIKKRSLELREKERKDAVHSKKG